MLLEFVFNIKARFFRAFIFFGILSIQIAEASLSVQSCSSAHDHQVNSVHSEVFDYNKFLADLRSTVISLYQQPGSTRKTLSLYENQLAALQFADKYEGFVDPQDVFVLWTQEIATVA